MNQKPLRFQIFVIVVSALAFIGLGVLGTVVFMRLTALDEAYGLPMWLLALAFFTLLIVAGRGIRDRILAKKAMELENLYVFGHKCPFYNIYHFQRRVENLRSVRRLSKKEQYLVAFTFAPHNIAANPNYSEEIANFNYAVACHLDALFTGEKRLRLFAEHAFGFQRGIFYLYLFVDKGEEVDEFCQRLNEDIYALSKTTGAKVYLSPCFGIAKIGPEEHLVAAIDNAQMARTYAENTFQTIAFYHESFRVNVSSNDIEELEKALDQHEFVVYYQPKFSLKEKRFVSSEALVRWNSPKYGLLAPGSFIERAEHAGLISRIDLYVFEAALSDIAETRRKGRRCLPVSVNFSLYEFFSPNFLDVILGLIEKYKVPPTLVEIEITETTSQANQFMSVSIIKKLKDVGIRVLMDDFGVGYSGLDNLRKIPFDAIKVDKSFADLMLEDEKTRSIVKFIVELGHLNDIEVVIEGVDNAEQVDMLRKMKMDTIQGFYYSKPLPLDKFDAFLKDNPFEGKGGAK